MLSEKNPYIKEAYETLQEVSQDRATQLEYLAREKAIRDHNYLMAESRRQGVEHTAKNLIRMGAETDFIAAATNLSQERIEDLRKECPRS